MGESDLTSAELELLCGLAELFAELGLQWYVFGGQAAIAYGARRSTNDIDVSVLDGTGRVPEIVAGLTRRGWELLFDDDEFVRRTRVLPARSTATGLGLDIVLAGDPYEVQIASRARPLPELGLPIPVAAPEDVVVMKLLAGRPRDLDDVRAIVREQVALDERYVRSLLVLLQESLSRDDLLEPFDDALARRAR